MGNSGGMRDRRGKCVRLRKHDGRRGEGVGLGNDDGRREWRLAHCSKKLLLGRDVAVNVVAGGDGEVGFCSRGM